MSKVEKKFGLSRKIRQIKVSRYIIILDDVLLGIKLPQICRQCSLSQSTEVPEGEEPSSPGY